MTAVRFSFVTVECDSADEELMRELVERFAPARSRVAVVQLPPAPPTEAPAPVMAPAKPPEPAAVDPLASAAQELGRRGGVKGGAERARRMTPEERSASAKEAATKRWVNARPKDEEESEPAPALPQPVAAPPLARRVEHDIKDVVESEAAKAGHVAGVTTPTAAPGSLAEKITKAVAAEEGITIDQLARLLLGKADAVAVRRIDMIAGPIIMSGKLARYNGRLFSNMKQAAALRLPPPVRSTTGTKRDAAPQQDVRKLHDRIVARFAKDNATPLRELADELFGESVGHTYEKLQLMLRQLVASERLKRVGAGQYAPVDDKASQGDDESEDADEQELESNGQPDENDDLEELDVG